MTSEEREHVLQLLQESEKQYLSSIKDINQTQWTWKPAPDRWSVGQTAEHILHSEVIVFRALQRATQSQADPDWEIKTAGKTELIERLMPDRSQKAEAPAPTHPQGLCLSLSKDDLVRRFRELRAEIVKFARETQIPLKKHTAEHPFPVLATLNAYQWLLLVPLHHMRHVQQIVEVKASPGYPE